MVVRFTNRRLLPVRTFTSRAPLGWCLEQGLLSLDLHARIDEHAHRVGLPRVAAAEACTGQVVVWSVHHGNYQHSLFSSHVKHKYFAFLSTLYINYLQT